VAAAVAINLSSSRSRATVATGLTISAGGKFTLSSKTDSDAQATADGGAVQPSKDGSSSGGAGDGTSSGSASDGTPSGVAIGAAVAINKADITNEAVLPAGTTVTATGAAIEAGMASTNELGASATSGAGGGKVGVA